MEPVLYVTTGSSQNIQGDWNWNKLIWTGIGKPVIYGWEVPTEVIGLAWEEVDGIIWNIR